jgi:hypothetical protein
MEVSVDAKNQYLAMLSSAMTPIMTTTFTDMYKEAIERGHGHRDNVQKNFKLLLEDITNWNNSIIQTHAKEYTTACPYFSDLLAAVFVCYIKILSSVRITKDNKKIQIKLPPNADFIHACINNAGKEFMHSMEIFREQNPTVRDRLIREVCAKNVEKTMNELIPVQTILRTYMNPDTNEFSLGGTVEDEPMEEEEPVEEEEPPEAEEEPLEATDDVKNIDVPQPPVPAPVDVNSTTPTLFEDAPEVKPQQKFIGR